MFRSDNPQVHNTFGGIVKTRRRVTYSLTERLGFYPMCALMILVGCGPVTLAGADSEDGRWILVDDFESDVALESWTNVDAQNDTDPHVPNPQIAEVRNDQDTGNRYMIRKPAADGVVGNRKAIGFVPLPTPVEVGETYTFFTRVNVEYFPNNQSFGLVNVAATDIPGKHYDSFEPMLRITDKFE